MKKEISISNKNEVIAKMMGWKLKEPLLFNVDWNWIMMACKELMGKYKLNVRFDMMDVFVMDAETDVLFNVDFTSEMEWIDAVFEAVYLASKYVLENDFSTENE